VLELVEDADLFRGRFAAGCCALGARSGWHVGIRFEGKSGHFKRVEMIGSSREILRWLLAVQLDYKMVAEGEIKGFMYASRTALADPEYAEAHRTLLACHSPPSSDSLSVKKMPWRQCCPSYAQRDPPQLQGPETFDLALSYRKNLFKLIN
jgi:hypothetical protein